MQKSFSDYTPKLVGASILGISLIIALYTLVLSPVSQKTSTSASTADSAKVASVSKTTSSVTSAKTSISVTSTSPSIADGTYTDKVSYRVPHETNSIAVSVTIKNGAVTAVSTNHDYADQESGYYTDSFDSLIESKVVGKKLDAISLSRVGGASLTTEAFDQALSVIANQAKA